MGCDIHFIIEQKVGNEWIGIMATDVLVYDSRPKGVHRNYDFFEALNGTRSEGERKKFPNGLPNDLSSLAKMCVNKMGTDAHSHSYCTAEEFCQAFKNTRRADILEAEKILGVYVKMFDDCNSPSLEELRVIYFFDN